MQAHIRALPFSRLQDLCVPGRLDSSCKHQAIGYSTSSSGSGSSSTSWMDGQLQEIRFDSYSTIGTPRLCIEYPHNDGITSNEETSRHSSFHQTSAGSPSQTISSCSAQPHNANTGGNFCHIPSPAVYTAPSLLQEPNCQVGKRLDPSLTLDSASIQELTWWYHNLQKWNGRSLLPSTPTQTIFVDASDTGWGCSWQNQRAHGYWTPIEAAQSINWRELKAAHLALKTFRVPKNSTILIKTDNTTSLSDRSLELVSSPQYNDPGSAYQRNSQHNGGHGVSSNLLQEPMADQTFCIRGAQQDMRSFYNQPLRRPNNEIIAKVRVLASGSGCYPHGCVFHPIDEANESLRKSSLESHFSDITEDQARTTPLHSSGGPLLAQRDLVPSVDQMALSRQLFLPPQAVETTSHKTANLNEQAIQDLFTQKLASNPTNKTYRKNQLRFLEWANHNWVSFTAFSGADLINFLATIRQTHNFQVATLKTIRAAVAYLHDNPPSISEDSSINSYLDSLSRQAPPVSIHREQVDMTPSLDYACSIPSQSGTSVKSLQQKLAFLLAMAAFLRPSNLARIPFSSCEVRESDGCLKFQVVYPKETRKKRRIIKPFTVHPHTRDRELYPVQCFIALRDHPDLQARPENSTLFIKSNNIRQPLSASTLSSWLHREFISLSTSESRVSIRSLTSSRALDEGVSMDHIVTLGNWVSSGTFQDHYQRNQMAMIDFTSTVLSGSNDDEFFDASDTFSLD
ncbi:hypothetical protein G6F38_011484 [Rhizopus arrhizus]|nr:hypothetical protein G6F38_011484 [Rhizopus arrhizus]